MFVSVALLDWIYFALGTTPNRWQTTGIAVVVCAWAAWKIRRSLKKAHQLKLGRDGERWVAQYLEGLRTLDFHVYHDVPIGDANIDHVLIGTRGIFSIETKTLSKPERGECRIVVAADGIAANGQMLTRNPIVQAKAQAGWLKNFYGEVGSKVSVQPIVVFPGWFVEKFDHRALGVWVMEPKALDSFLAHEPEVIPVEQVRMLAKALATYIRQQAKL